ncbi:hypothetical protein HaLaN_30743, partial [Haematococcus lacustris]
MTCHDPNNDDSSANSEGLGQQPGWLAKLGQQLGRLTAQSQLLRCLPWLRLRHGVTARASLSVQRRMKHCEQPQEHHDFMGE